MESAESGGKREAQAEKVINFLRRAHAFEFINSEKARKASFEDFRDFLVRINGIARDIPIVQRTPDGENVALEGFIESALVPKQDDKELLLREAYSAQTEIRNLGDEAYMLPAVVNAVHAFSDGNGRTSRVLHLLLRSHDSEEELNGELREALGKDGRFDSFDINPGIIGFEIENIVTRKHGVELTGENAKLPDNLTRLRIDDSVKSKPATTFDNLFNSDSRYCFVALYEYLKKKEILDKVVMVKDDFSEEFTLEDNYKAISLQKTDETFSEADWVEVLNLYYALKKEHVQVLIDLFVHPDNYKTEDQSTTLRDLFLKEISERYERNRI